MKLNRIWFRLRHPRRYLMLKRLAKRIDMEMLGKGWDDYDKNGTPYWEKLGKDV